MLQLRAGAALIDLVETSSRRGRLGEAGRRRRPQHGPCRSGDRTLGAGALRAHLAAHGVDIVEEGMRYGARGDGYSVYVRDPAGNTVELKGP